MERGEFLLPGPNLVKKRVLPKFPTLFWSRRKDDKSYVAGSCMYDVTAADIKAKFPGNAMYEDE